MEDEDIHEYGEEVETTIQSTIAGGTSSSREVYDEELKQDVGAEMVVLTEVDDKLPQQVTAFIAIPLSDAYSINALFSPSITSAVPIDGSNQNVQTLPLYSENTQVAGVGAPTTSTLPPKPSHQHIVTGATELYVCSHCTYRTHCWKNFRYHKRAHEGKLYSCPDCQYETYDRHRLKRHSLVHSGVKAFPCTYEGCDYRGRDQCSLSIHQRKHTGDKPYSCPMCDYATSHRNALIRHRYQHHPGYKPFRCEVCSFQTHDKGYLASHVRIKHSDPNDIPMYRCDMCTYSTARKPDMRKHNITHVRRGDVMAESVGIKPLHCQQFECEYIAYTYHDLNVHFRTHTGYKPYECNQCEYTCAQKSQLKRHEGSHSKVKPFPCDQCDFRASDKYTLNRHKKLLHDVNKTSITIKVAQEKNASNVITITIPHREMS